MEFDVERLEAAQHGKADAPRGDRAHLHGFEIVRALDAIRDIPSALEYPLMGRKIIADQRQSIQQHTTKLRS
jgi:hypothetical protein